jgi:hypothetical protein
VPRVGRDSIWIATAERGGERARGKSARRTDLVNLRTRAESASWLEARLAALAKKGRVLAGFDFPFGYPAGTAARLGLNGTAWRSLWTELAEKIADGADNANNRFDLAEDWNRRIGGEAFPFWGNVREEPVLTTLTDVRTPDLGGRATTAEFTAAVHRHLSWLRWADAETETEQTTPAEWGV